MDIQICKEFLKNMRHGYALLKVHQDEIYELVEYNQEFKEMFKIKEGSFKDFLFFIKQNNDILNINLLDAIHYLRASNQNEFANSSTGYNINLTKEIVNNEELIFILILNISGNTQKKITNYESFINSTDEMIIVSDYDGNIIFSNEQVSNKLGYTREELKTLHILDLHPTEKKFEAEEILNNFFMGNLDVCPLPVAKKDGEIVPVETRVWFGEWNGKECIYSISKDISTEQEALQKFIKIFKKNPVCMTITSITTKAFTQVNDAFLTTYGYSEAEVIGKTGVELKIFDNDIFTQVYEDIMSKGYFRDKIISASKKDGDLIIGKFSGEIIESQNEKFIVSFMVDLTKQVQIQKDLDKKSELQNLLIDLASRYINCPLDNFNEEIQQSLKKVGLFVDADRVYIFDYDFDAQTTSNTYEWCRDYIEPQIDLLQNVPLEIIPDWVSAHLEGKTIIIEDVALLDGEISSVKEILSSQNIKSLITIPMMLENKCLGYVGFDSVRKYRVYTESEIDLLKFYIQILVNIHMRKLHETMLLTAESMAIKATRSKDLFIAKTSHELRNPLNGAWGFLNLLKEIIGEGKKKDYLLNALSALSNTIQIANDLLDISRMENNNFDLNYTDINIYGLFEDAISPFIHTIDALKIKLNLTLDETIPYNLVSDFVRLKQIIGNLVSNAISHSGANKIEIGCKVKKLKPDSVQLLFYVKDNGVGISKKDQEHIFDYFYKTNSSSSGTGLGLPIIKELIVKLGGALWLESTVENGSAFFFTLPFKLNNMLKIKVPNQRNTIRDLRGLRILAAEDDPINQILIKEMLKPHGIFINVVSNGVELLNELEANHYDLILIDIQMPIMGGLEASQIINRSQKPIPIIALTAAILPEEKEKYYKCGIASIVEKPISIDSLINEINFVL